MRQIIYGVLPLVISICSMASVIWLLSSFVGLEFLLVAGGCFVAFASIVTLAEELVEWHRHREASPVQRQLLPPAFCGSSYPSSVGMGGCLFRTFVPAAKAAIGSL
jgi:hypothetical protein